MIIYTNDNNPNALKLIIVAKSQQCEYTLQAVPPNEKFSRLPVVKLPCGTELFSVSAALQFISSNESEEFDIMVNKWLEWDSTQLQPALVSYGSSGTLDTSHKPRVWSLLYHLNCELKAKKYLINSEDNSNLSTADISIWTSLWSTIAVTEVMKKIAIEFVYVDRWIKEIEQLRVIKDALEEFKIERGLKCLSSINSVSWYPMNSYTGGKSLNSGGKSMDMNKEEEMENESKPEVTEQEIDYIKSNWSNPTPVSMTELPHPVLPKKGERNILVTSALPYVNNVPHLGNIIGCVLSADIFARYCRQRNYNTLYISGTDEYGTATEAKAFQEKMTPQEICDKYFNIHNDVYRWFNIGFDYFGRTTTPEQTKIVQDFFLRIKSEGYIFSQSIYQLYCKNCEKSLADRFVEGICPRCRYPDARGDQCDGCGHLIDATDLRQPRCKICNQTPTIQKSDQFFLNLCSLQPKLKEWAAISNEGWSSVAVAVAKPWLRYTLRPRCITRDLKWGIPVPLDEYRDKVFYVWFDAPLGYISITKKYTNEYEQWWRPKKDVDVHLYQFMAKDNVPFHAIMFPATLLAANQGYTLVKHIMAVEYLNYEDTKFSKSRGIGVFGTDAKETGIPSDVWRFYLAYIRPETQDSNFNWIDLATKVNKELLNNFGNFINRALMFVEKNFNSVVPEVTLRTEDSTLLAEIQRELKHYIVAMEDAKLRYGLRYMLSISKLGNQYMQSQQPWVLIKGDENDKKNARTVIGLCCNIACLLSALMGPFMPSISRNLRSQLGLDMAVYGYIPQKVSLLLPSGHKIGKPAPLFTKIDEKHVEELRAKYGGKQNNGDCEKPKDDQLSVPNDIPSLEAAIAKQGNVVRDLKKKEPKTVWQPQVEILLKLKQRLAHLTGIKKK